MSTPVASSPSPEAAQPPERRPPDRAGIVRWCIAVAVVLAAIAGLVIVRSRRVVAERHDREDAAAAGPRVLVMPVQHAPVERDIELPATIHGYVETPIYAKLAGYLKTIYVDKGDRVRQGQLLALIDSPELDKQVADMEADHAIKALTDRRDQKVAQAGALSREEADVAHADTVKAQAILEQYRALQSYERITAPVDGLVTARSVDPGALIPQTTSSSGGTPILTVATIQPVRVYADVPQNLTPFVKDGSPAFVTVTQYPKRSFDGVITRHPDALAATTRTMLVEVDLPNADSALLPGMYGILRLHVSQANVARVPDDALVFRDGKVYVPTIRDGHLHLAQATLGDDNGRDVEILDGVSEQDVVALNIGQAVQDGDAAQPVLASPAAAATPASTPVSVPATPERHD
jgi:membrane fusion protein, multidrug efflux system